MSTSVQPRSTLNPDEPYLQLHGFDTQIICRQPELLTDADVQVFHPHGFLPNKLSTSMETEFLVLSQYSYDERLGNQLEPWRQLITNILASKVGIFVGLSGDDPTFGPFLLDLKKKLGDDRPTGYWLLGPGDKNSPDLAKRNIVPLEFGSFDEFPKFLLGVCQKAAGYT